MTPVRSEQGVALPLTVFLVTLLTLMLAAVLVRVQVDRRVAESSGDMVDALAIAQSGLERYVTFYDSIGTRPSNGDSLRINIAGGYADVIARYIHDPDPNDRTYVIRSTGWIITPSMGADPQAARTVAQFARWGRAEITRPSAFTAANGFVHLDDGGDFEVDGDHDGCNFDETAGVYVAWAYRDIDSWDDVDIDGDPTDVLTDASFDADSVAKGSMIDWAAILGGGFTADYSAPPVDSDWSGWSEWPSFLVQGDLTIDASSEDYDGRGLLVVTGDLTLTGDEEITWRGVIIVGGTIDFNIEHLEVDGMIISGLNTLTGATPTPNTIGRDDTDIVIDYDPCDVNRAMDSVTGFSLIQNAWVDNWATY